MEELVPGDIVNIEAGDLVPADGRILTAATLEIDESALTGESAPGAQAGRRRRGRRGARRPGRHGVHEHPGDPRRRRRSSSPATGMATEVGHISGMLQASTQVEKTPLTKQLNTLTNQILVIAGLALAVIDRPRAVPRTTPFDELFLTAVAFAVSAIPTGLPAVVTAILSTGTQTLAAAGAIVKRLRSVETLGSTSRDQLRQDRAR